MKKFEGKRVLITGAAGGIGYHLAREFAAAGAELILTDINETALGNAVESIEAEGFRVLSRSVDISNREAVNETAKWVEETGGLDILVNNAGIGYSGELAGTSIETWEKLIKVNFFGPLYHIHAFLPSMKEKKRGHIVNVSSGQAFWRIPSWGAYAIVKLALGAYSELLHSELYRHGIRVTTVYPFMVDTGFYTDVAPKNSLGRLSMKLVPYYSMKPESVARIIFKAVKSKRRVEKVTGINNLGLLLRAVPPIGAIISTGTAYLLADKDEQ